MDTLAVVFDCDGTLVDSETLGHEVLCRCIANFGMSLSIEESMRRFKGGKMADCIAELEADVGHKLPDDFVASYRRQCAETFEARLVPIEGAYELLDKLELPYCIASSGPREKIDLNLRVTGLARFFGDRIFSAYDIDAWKPDPALFLHAAKQMGVRPERCAVVEDSVHGYEAGVSAGMRVFALQGDPVPDAIAESVQVINRLVDLLPLLTVSRRQR